jgi:hypothetical protein
MIKSGNRGRGGLKKSSTCASASSPRHYNQHPSGVECITITQHFNFNCGNVIKYIWRQGLKEGESNLTDLMKAKTYIEFEIERVKDEKATNIRNKQK